MTSVAHVGLALTLPEKDFRARLVDGRIAEIGIGLQGSDIVAFQPFYRLSTDTTAAWVAAVERFVARGETGVYAENALNPLLPLDIYGLDYSAVRSCPTAGKASIAGSPQHGCCLTRYISRRCRITTRPRQCWTLCAKALSRTGR